MGKSGLVIKRQKEENGIEKMAMGENLLYSKNVKKEKQNTNQMNQYSLISK